MSTKYLARFLATTPDGRIFSDGTAILSYAPPVPVNSDSGRDQVNAMFQRDIRSHFGIPTDCRVLLMSIVEATE